IIAVERDEDIVNLISHNCDRFGVKNVTIFKGNAPECFEELRPLPDRICIEGGRPIKKILTEAWRFLKPDSRLVATAHTLENLYLISEGLSELQARNMEVVQAGVNRLETRGLNQVFAAVDPSFILSGEKF
ncbi:MAG TPA: precorrin-6B methylase, partial [Cyanothece sp. UBA12306]|nr:precorrin-6B methylase [Cyanothece sp. UBA12306]